MRGGGRGGGARMRREDGEPVRGESELKGLWKGYFEQLMNNEAEGEAVVKSMGIEPGRGCIPMKREIGRLEVEEAIAKLKCGKVMDKDGITAEMLKYGGNVPDSGGCMVVMFLIVVVVWW